MKTLTFDPTRPRLMLCWLAYMQFRSGREIWFADSETAITIDGNTFLPMPGFKVSSMREMLGGDEQSVTFDFAHAENFSTIFQTSELYQGVFDGVRLSLWIIDRNQIPTSLGEPGDRYFIAKVGPTNISTFQRGSIDIRSLKEQNVTKTQVYQPTCRTDLFSDFCGLKRADYAHTATVASIIDTYNFTIYNLTPSNPTLSPSQPDGYFDQGFGVSVGGIEAFEIAKWVRSTNTLTLYLPVAVAGLIEVGMDLTIWPGCDWTIDTCASKFGNSLNFQGEAHSAGYAAAVGGG